MTRTSLRAVLAGLWVVPLTIFYGTLILLSLPLSRRGRFLMPLGRRWSRSVLRAAGVTVCFEGLGYAKSRPALLFMANHESMLDIPALALALPDSLRFVAKRSLQWIPFFGWALTATGGCIFIDRANFSQAVKSLERAAERIREGFCVMVFPEGTRSRDGKLGEFKKGPFHLALAARVPVVPVAISGTRALMPRKSLTIGRGEVRVRFGAPIAVEPGATPNSLSAAVRQAMSELLDSR